ncbi:MAG: cation/acetate symporter, partial [Frankiaceae bacterium]|nr:cation/acetate symporter [Frankiaceae bacterium]
MPATILAAASTVTSGQKTLTIALFLVFVAVTLYITVYAGRKNRDATDFYAGGRNFSAMQNGIAIGGDYMSA